MNKELTKILSRLSAVEASALLLANEATQLRKELERFNAPAPKGGLSDSERALLKRKFYKTTLKQ